VGTQVVVVDGGERVDGCAGAVVVCFPHVLQVGLLKFGPEPQFKL